MSANDIDSFESLPCSDYAGIARVLEELLGASAVAIARRRGEEGREARCIFRSPTAPPNWSVHGAVPSESAVASGPVETRIWVDGGPSTAILVVTWTSRPLSRREQARVKDAVAPLVTSLRLAASVEAYSHDRALHEAVLSTLVDAVITIREDGTILEVNAAAEKLFGYPSSALVGRNVSMLMPEPDASQHDRYLRRYLDSGTPRIIGFGRETRARRADGSIFPARLAVSEVRGAGERYFAGILRDISDLKASEAAVRGALEELRGSQVQLLHAEKLSSMGRMVAGVAHELNNPIMSILTFAQYCARRTEPGDRRRAVLEDIEREAERCATIVRGLLDFSRPGPKTPREHKALDMAEVVSRARSLFSLRLAQEDVSLTLTVEDGLPKVLAEGDELQQVVINLVTNALDALRGVERQDRAIRLHLGALDSVVRLSVSDNGPGMDESTAARVFDPFFTTKSVGEGTGLGLSISHGIARAHGGTLRCHSVEGAGTRFDLDLPIQGASAWEESP